MLLTAERLVAGGDALARADDGRVVFVPGALPGERVAVEIVSTKRDFARARLVEVVDPSDERVVPLCPHRRAGCGGCGWMHLRPPVQLDAKCAIVAESLQRIARLDGAAVDRLVVAGGAVEPMGYRSTIRVVGGSGGRIGYREHGSDDVVEVDSCPVAVPALSRLLPDIEADAGAEVTLRASVATGAVTATWRRRDHGRIRGLPAHVHVGARAWLIERVAGTELRVSARSFFQSGVQAAELLVTAVADAAPELATSRHAVDAYGGVGLFAATAMREAEEVTVVESSASACADAARNLVGRRAHVVRSEVADWVPQRSAGTAPVDAVVADPARTGLGRSGATALAVTGPEVLVLVSCDPVSLARDLGLLSGLGYRPERIAVFDLFPNTHHVETVTRLVRSAGSPTG